MAFILSEKEDAEFKQMVLLAVNIIWLLLEHLYLDRNSPIKFSIIRVVYFGFLGITRIDLFDHPETDDNFWPKLWKMTKVFVADFLSMCFLIWAFGRSLIYPVTIAECAFLLCIMFLPERTFSPYKSFVWHLSIR